jgi:hypothetical protein
LAERNQRFGGKLHLHLQRKTENEVIPLKRWNSRTRLHGVMALRPPHASTEPLQLSTSYAHLLCFRCTTTGGLESDGT